jgi:DnaJ-class molecular chaperone
MKPTHEQDHYEILELSRGARPEDIERAYHMAQLTYAPDSLALYSVFGELDAASIRERVETAYRVLSDSDARREYDRQRADADSVTDKPQSADPLRSATELSGASESFRDLEAAVEEEGGDFDGARLRRARLRRGIELEQISQITKVSAANLGHLEHERFADLPATVYVRGFVKAYAKTIGLDPQRVAASYMTRVEEARADHARGRLLGRR